MNPVEPEPNSRTIEHNSYQFSIQSLLIFVTIIAILCSVGASIHWFIPIGLSMIAVSIALLTILTTKAGIFIARIILVAAQIVGIGINSINLIIAGIAGLIGFIHGTDTSAYFNNILAVVGLTCATITLANCLSLVVARRAFFQILLPIAFVGNCITFGLAILSYIQPKFEAIGGLDNCIMFYGLTYISTNAIAVRAAYLLRTDQKKKRE